MRCGWRQHIRSTYGISAFFALNACLFCTNSIHVHAKHIQFHSFFLPSDSILSSQPSVSITFFAHSIAFLASAIRVVCHAVAYKLGKFDNIQTTFRMRIIHCERHSLTFSVTTTFKHVQSHSIPFIYRHSGIDRYLPVCMANWTGILDKNVR